ncbi:unnamed protein product [Leuciscus chuanchicus]
MAGGLDFGLAHFGISPAPQTEEIETSSTGGQHLLCREMQMETCPSVAPLLTTGHSDTADSCQLQRSPRLRVQATYHVARTLQDQNCTGRCRGLAG